MSLSEKLSYTFRDQTLLDQALTHRSFHNENTKKSQGHNELLEFLGDSVLDFSLSDQLMKRYPDLAEGELSKIRASLVNEEALASVARELGLDGHIRLGKGEYQSGGTTKPRLLSSALEALFGAIYRDADFLAVDTVIKNVFASRVDSLDLEVHFRSDYKTRLQEKLQELKRPAPLYVLSGESGPDHDKTFFVTLKLSEEASVCGQGRSKKQAEQDAARQALEVLP
jgi:ribonuclease-3